MDFAKNTLFKSYGVICSPQRTLTVSTARRIGLLELLASSRLLVASSSSVGVLATPLMHDVELWLDGMGQYCAITPRVVHVCAFILIAAMF